MRSSSRRLSPGLAEPTDASRFEQEWVVLVTRCLKLCAAALLILGLVMSAGAETKDRGDLGRGTKLRVLVDKVLMADNKWVMTEQHVKEIAAAGFNVVSPRLGNDDYREVRRIASLAQQQGIFHMPWMRGDMIAKGKVKMVWADGTEQELASPNSDELWNWMNSTILEYARISTECPALIGVFLDYENYSPGGEGNLYGLSYDDKILGDFARSRKIELPTLPFAERAGWLRQHKLDSAFAAFQIDHWRQRCRTLRKLVDEINPGFQFCVYPAPGTLFITEAIYREWGTAKAPLILADPSIYGRPAGLLPHMQSLQANRTTLLRNQAYAREHCANLMYMGGLDPVVKGADPEFCGRNAAMSAAETDGYWIFYEGPTYRTTHPEYFRWFSRANREIKLGRADRFWQRPRRTPDPGDAAGFRAKTNKPQLAVFDNRQLMRQMIEQEGTFEVHELQGLALDYLKHFSVVILQNYNVAQAADEPFSRALRAYVEQGGGLMLAHDTAWFMESPFPEIATRGYPQHKVEAQRHVVDTNLKVACEHPALAGLTPGTEFPTEFRDHMIFRPGPKGVTVITNTFGDPVYVLGEVGKGRVAFVGPYQGYKQQLSGVERQAFLGVTKWLGSQ